jgi:hypothetical protein
MVGFFIQLYKNKIHDEKLLFGLQPYNRLKIPLQLFV